jgi:TonB family protein
MFAKLHLFSQDLPEKSDGLRWRAHPYLRMAGALLKGPAVFDWSARQRADLEALWRDPDSEGARERLAGDLAAFCDKLGWTADAQVLEDADKRGGEYMLTLSAVPPELYVLPWEVIRVGETGTYLADHESAQVRYAIPGLPAREIQTAPPRPGVLFAWSSAGGEVPHEEQAAAIRAAAAAGGVAFRELANVDPATLQAALDAGPPSVLHLLCHGVAGSDGEPSGLKWGTLDQPSEISAPRLARMLRHHDGALRLVVLSACGSGDGRGDPMLLGSLAQELHRNGIRSVVASRYPLSVPGSQVMTRALYDKMLGEAWSLERALRHTRQTLLRVGGDGEAHPGDAYGIQLYAYDTERFASDNAVEAERPVLASYPFGTAACPVPGKGPPRVELTLKVDAEAALARKQLMGELQRVSEDDRLTATIAPGGEAGASELKVVTTVDGSQRLLRSWRSKVLPVAIGMLVLDLAKTANASPLPPIQPTVPHGPAGTLGKVAATAGKAIGAKAAVALIGVATAVGVTAAVVYSQPSAGVTAAVVRPQPPVVRPQPPVVAPPPAVQQQPSPQPSPPSPSPPQPSSQQPPRPSPRPPHSQPQPVCGNGKLERGEECDDGNTLDADGCSSTCQIEPPACGNGKVEAGEQCDDGNLVDGDGCSSTCQREAPAVCGNGKLERGEECDDGNLVDGDGCSPTCRIEADPLIHISDKLQRVAGKVNIRPSPTTRSLMERAGVSSVTGLFEVCISRDGGVTGATVKQSTGYDDYDAKLLRSIHDWRYQPHMINGAPAPVCSTVEYVFQLQ